jgi:hypothetical protein
MTASASLPLDCWRIEPAGGVVIENGAPMIDRDIMRRVA